MFLWKVCEEIEKDRKTEKSKKEDIKTERQKKAKKKKQRKTERQKNVKKEQGKTEGKKTVLKSFKCFVNVYFLKSIDSFFGCNHIVET